MSDLRRGDIVSLSTAQTSTATVDTATTGQDYTVTLPINATPKDFTHTALTGQTVDDIADALELILLRDQTFYSVVVGPSSNQLTIVGPRGFTFVLAVTANMTAAVFESAVNAINDQTGDPIGDLRVVQAESSADKLRSYATRSADGTVLELEDVLLREVGKSTTFDVRRGEILTVVEQVGDPT